VIQAVLRLHRSEGESAYPESLAALGSAP
jgi:hypothetical protein